MEWILEISLRILAELVLHGLAYGSGYAILKILSLGRLRIAPYLAIEERRRGRKGREPGIWLHRPMQARALKAEVAVAVGLTFWIAVLIGGGLWLAAGE